MSTETAMDRLERSLPAGFDFYHLGKVTGQANPAPVPDLAALFDGCTTLGFSIQGDLQGLLIVAFEKDLDVSTYTELGNVIASQTATLLSRREGIDVMISPPHTLSPERIQSMLPQLATTRNRVWTYLHRSADRPDIPVHVVICEAGLPS